MVDESQPRSVRLPTETTEQIDKLDISLRELIQEAVKNKTDDKKIDNKKQKIDKVVTNGIWICVGMVFFMILGSQTNIIGIALVGCMGSAFTILGAYNLYLAFKKEGYLVRKK